MNILLVLPDPAISGFLEAGLTDAGYRVQVARNAAQARACARASDHSVVIVDVLGSTELLRRVARVLQQAQPTTRVLALAAPDLAEGTEVESYADGCLTKPFKFDALLARVRSLSHRDSGSPVHAGSE